MSSDNESDADEQDGSAADEDTTTGGEGAADDEGGDDDDDDDGGFGDDFDDFEEGGEGDDFGDFDDGFQQQGEEEMETTFDKAPEQPSVPAPPPGPVSQQYSIPGLHDPEASFMVMHWLTGSMRSLCLISKISARLRTLPLPYSPMLMRCTPR